MDDPVIVAGDVPKDLPLNFDQFDQADASELLTQELDLICNKYDNTEDALSEIIEHMSTKYNLNASATVDENGRVIIVDKAELNKLTEGK